jgi:hypothetical protein
MGRRRWKCAYSLVIARGSAAQGWKSTGADAVLEIFTETGTHLHTEFMHANTL